MNDQKGNRRDGLQADGTVESKHVENEEDLVEDQSSGPIGATEGHNKDSDENLDRAASTTQEEQENLDV